MRVSEEKIRKIVRESIIKNIKEGALSRFFQKSKNFSPEEGDQDVGKSLTPDTSASIKGSEFVVHGVKFQSEPAEGAGNMAAKLYQSAEKAGQSSSGKKWETTPAGRQWISKHIYDAAKPGSGAKWSSKLGTKEESHWSSWFFSVCYMGFKGEGGHGSYEYDYAADEGIKRRKDILENPDSYKGKIAFVTFAPNEAPVYKGDAVFNFRSGSGSKFSDIANGVKSHMRIFADDNGTVHGGNESNKIGKGKVSLSTKRTVSGKYGREPYAAVYKRVRVIGKV